MGVADIPWDASISIAELLTFVDLVSLEVVSRGSKYIADCRMSMALRRFKYKLDVIGLARKSRSGRVVRTAKGTMELSETACKVSRLAEENHRLKAALAALTGVQEPAEARMQYKQHMAWHLSHHHGTNYL